MNHRNADIRAKKRLKTGHINSHSFIKHKSLCAFDVQVIVRRKIRYGKEPATCNTYGVYSLFLAQHVSGINMPIIRSKIWRIIAFNVQHCYCRLGSRRAELLAVCTVWKLLFDSRRARYPNYYFLQQTPKLFSFV
jgi:hypothetical protein